MKILFIGGRLFDEVALYAQSKGITTILTESNPKSPNLKLADKVIIVSRGMENPMQIAITEDVDAVIPLIGIDKPLIEVARMKNILEKDHDLPVIASGLNATNISSDKFKTKEFLIQNNIPTPKFIEITKKEYLNSKSKLKFPNVLKQSEGQGGAGVKIALSPPDVDAYFQSFPQAMVEDFLSGPELSVEVLRWEKKSVPLVAVHKGHTTLEGIHPLNKIRTAPAEVQNLNNQKLRTMAKKITNDINASGITEVEFIFDEKKQEINTLEINTRPCGIRFLSLSSSDINPMHQLVHMALGEWKPHKIERRIKEYTALEMPLKPKEYQLITPLSSKNITGLGEKLFTEKKPWIIHGPEQAGRITVRAKNVTQCLNIINDLKKRTQNNHNLEQ